jgi:hypothetical protein
LVWLARDNSFIFIHVPKTGGSAVGLTLERYGLVDRVPGRIHRTLRQSGLADLGAFSFAFVRNPWDRQVSMYTYLSQHPSPHYNHLKLHKDGFRKWLLTGGMRVQRQSMLTYAEGCDFIGKFETLQQDFDAVCERVGLPKITLDRVNVSSHKPYQLVYDNEMREAVAEWFKSDIERFNYAF